MAAFYGAAYREFPDTAHNIMMEHNYRESAQVLHEWLCEVGIE